MNELIDEITMILCAAAIFFFLLAAIGRGYFSIGSGIAVGIEAFTLGLLIGDSKE